MAPSMTRGPRVLAGLVVALTVAVVMVVGAAPPAAAGTDGPFQPGTTTSDTMTGHAVEFRIEEQSDCLGPWTATFTPQSAGLSGLVSTPASGMLYATPTVSGTIVGPNGTLGTLKLTITWTGSMVDENDQEVPCTDEREITINFTITAPSVATTATLAKKKALPGYAGTLTSTEGCQEGRSVRLYKVVDGPDTKLATVESTSAGAYQFPRKIKPGKYYVKSPAAVRPAVTCQLAKSPVLKVS